MDREDLAEKGPNGAKNGISIDKYLDLLDIFLNAVEQLVHSCSYVCISKCE